MAGLNTTNLTKQLPHQEQLLRRREELNTYLQPIGYLMRVETGCSIACASGLQEIEGHLPTHSLFLFLWEAVQSLSEAPMSIYRIYRVSV